jgi:hypothetical protein
MMPVLNSSNLKFSRSSPVAKWNESEYKDEKKMHFTDSDIVADDINRR